MTKLSARDHQALLALHEFQRQGIAPSVRELMQAWGVVGMQSYYQCVKRLENAGYVRRGSRNERRQLEIVRLPPTFTVCPHCGSGGPDDENAQEIRTRVREIKTRSLQAARARAGYERA